MVLSAFGIFNKQLPVTCNIMVKFSRIFQRNTIFNNKYKIQHVCSVLFSRHVSLYGTYRVNRQIHEKDVSFNRGESEEDTSSMRHTQIQENELRKVIQENRYLSFSEWDAIKDSVLSVGGAINEKNIDGFIMRSCVSLRSFACGKSYLKYINNNETYTFNLSVIKNFFWLCYVCRSSCTDGDLKDIDKIYDYVKTNYPILDANTAECIVMGLSITKHWRDYEKYFSFIKQTCTPNSHVYSAVVEAAFLNNDCDLGWKIMNEMMLNNKKPTDNVYYTFLQLTNKENIHSRLETLFKFLSNYDLNLSKSLSIKVKEIFDGIRKQKAASAFTSITTR